VLDPRQLGNCTLQRQNALEGGRSVPWIPDLFLRSLTFIRFTFTEGWPAEFGPWDAIHVGAAAAAEVPAELTAALAPGGRLLIPVGPPQAEQRLFVVDKSEGGALSVSQDAAAVAFDALIPPAAAAHAGWLNL
jgi:protein-L-isoaspartate O-methyltransferase